MRTKAVHRLHAAKVAAMATAVVMVTYLVATIVLNMFVVQRLTNQADVRLSGRLVDVRREVLSLPKTETPAVQRDHEVDMEYQSSCPSGLRRLMSRRTVHANRARTGRIYFPLAMGDLTGDFCTR